MDNRYLAILILGICIIIFLSIEKMESFENKDEKAGALYSWFKTNAEPSYTRFKREITGSNIVEYEDMRALISKKPNFNSDDIKNML